MTLTMSELLAFGRGHAAHSSAQQPPRSTTLAAARPGHRVILVHRIGAVITAAILATFGGEGLAGGLAFFSTHGRAVLGLSSNGLLSAVSLATAAILLTAAVRGGRPASTVLIVIGGLFLVSAFVNLAVLGTALNVLAFRLPNVFFSIGAGLVLLLVGAYGRLSGGLPDDNPYREPRTNEAVALPRQPIPTTPAEHAVDRAMAAAEVAVAQGAATPDQARRVAAISGLRTHEDRRRAWMAHDHDH
jgi:Domain of unknown function (DUF4383)